MLFFDFFFGGGDTPPTSSYFCQPTRGALGRGGRKGWGVVKLSFSNVKLSLSASQTSSLIAAVANISPRMAWSIFMMDSVLAIIALLPDATAKGDMMNSCRRAAMREEDYVFCILPGWP